MNVIAEFVVWLVAVIIGVSFAWYVCMRWEVSIVNSLESIGDLIGRYFDWIERKAKR